MSAYNKDKFLRPARSGINSNRPGALAARKPRLGQFSPQFLPRLRSSTSPGSSCNFSFNAIPTFLPEYMRKDIIGNTSVTKQNQHQTQRSYQPSQVKTPALISEAQQEKGEQIKDSFSSCKQQQMERNQSLSREDIATQTLCGNGEIHIDNLPSNASISLADIVTRLDSLSSMPQKIDSMSQDLKKLGDIKEAMDRMSSGLAQVQTDVHQLQQSVSHIKKINTKSQQDLAEVQAEVKSLAATVNLLKEAKVQSEQNQQALAKELLALRAKIKSQNPTQSQGTRNQKSVQNPSTEEFERLKMEAGMRKQNLIIEGIREDQYEREGSAEDQVFYFIQDVLGLSGIEVDMAYRLGKPRHNSAYPRPLFVRFTRLGDRMAVWRAGIRLSYRNNTHFNIKEDLPLQLRPTQTALLKVLQEARKHPDKYRNVSIRDFRLYVNGGSYGVEDLESLPEPLRPSSIATPGNREVVVFFGKDSRFSNHYLSHFEVGGRSYTSIEQYLAHIRARIMGRLDLEEKAATLEDPVEAKKLLHLLREEPQQEKWEDQRKEVLYTGLMAKFSQNSELKEYLISSGDRLLGEASLNKTWGIGHTLSSRSKFFPRQWRGGNLQGSTLMEVRQQLLLSKTSPTSQRPADHHQPTPDCNSVPHSYQQEKEGNFDDSTGKTRPAMA